MEHNTSKLHILNVQTSSYTRSPYQLLTFAQQQQQQSSGQQQQQHQHSNALLIVGDDFGYSDIGALGNQISTPNLDALKWILNQLRLTNNIQNYRHILLSNALLVQSKRSSTSTSRKDNILLYFLFMSSPALDFGFIFLALQKLDTAPIRSMA